MPLKIGILASGNGTNAQAIIDRIRAGILDAEITLIASNKPGAPVLARAEKAGLPNLALDHREFPDRLSFDLALAEALQASGAAYVILAGYMRLLTGAFLNIFHTRVLNIHPAILPSFPGLHGALDALDYGVKLTGPSVHFVEEQVDSGPLIIQAAAPVNADDDLQTLESRIHALEYRIYPQAIQWLAEGRISVEGRHVCLAPSTRPRSRPDGDWFVWPPLEKGF